MTLQHPTTGRLVEVADRDAVDWRAAGWLDIEPGGEPQTEDADPAPATRGRNPK